MKLSRLFPDAWHAGPVSEWTKHKRSVESANAIARTEERKLADFVKQHLRENPLSPEVQRALCEALRRKLPLCCDTGRKTLAGLVDPIWADCLNHWAYEYLSCSKSTDWNDAVLRLERLFVESPGEVPL